MQPSNKANTIFHEAKILRLLRDTEGIPAIYWVGSENGLNIMVMELLGPNVQDMARLTSTEGTLSI